MKRIPRSREVTQSIRAVSREVKRALKELNQQAAKLLARGNYDGAQAMVETGRAISLFDGEVRALRRRWQELRAVGGKKDREEGTLQWEFYQPILRALSDLGGKGKRRDIEEKVAEIMQDKFKPGDLVTNTRGIPRWQVMVRRSRKPMRAEGFLEDNVSPLWEITAAGRRAAKKGAGS